MPAWLSALIAAIWKVLEPFVAPLIAAKVGAELQDGSRAKQELSDVEAANHAAADVDADLDGMRDKWK